MTKQNKKTKFIYSCRLVTNMLLMFVSVAVSNIWWTLISPALYEKATTHVNKAELTFIYDVISFAMIVIILLAIAFATIGIFRASIGLENLIKGKEKDKN